MIETRLMDGAWLESTSIVIHLLCAALILTQGQGAPSFTPRPLSAFQQGKAVSLLRDRLPCLGCHELGGEGGQIGPSLSDLKNARTPQYIYSIVKDPQGVIPNTVMPRVALPESTVALIASYLAQRDPTPPRPRSDPPPQSAAPGGQSDGAGLYVRFCAHCHGVSGRGDGYNAPFLPVRPTVHADSAYMSRRSDDALFDATFAGGYIMNRSNRMPPFGQTLTRAQIWDLVRYLRTLCRCEGPPWSRD